MDTSCSILPDGTPVSQTMKYTNNVIVLVCMQDRDNNADLLNLALVSLRRKSRYRDNIVL